ncbi:MAG: carotenoid biosynthesis protein [Spirochaetes bacterium]|nr:carotenoid biosynthesis protein [Spirochaetota bacterium]
MTIIKTIIKEIWDHLPVWFIFYITAYTVFGYSALLKGPRPDYALTFVFPYGWFIFYYFARFNADGGLDAQGIMRRYLAVAAITAVVLAAVAAVARPVRLGPDWPSHVDASLWYYETANVLWTLLIALHCLVFRGWKKLLLFFGVAFVYGMVLESSGVTMGFFFEDHYHLYVPGFSAPVATMFGWSMVFYPCVFLLDGLRKGIPAIGSRSFPWQGLLVALIAVSLDALIDPFATDFGLWTWNGDYNRGNSLYWFGVPLVNFVSWFTAVFSFGVAYYFFELKKAGWDQIKRTAAMACSLPLVLAVAGVIEFTALGLVEGFNGPSWSILRKYISDGMPLTREPKKGKIGENHDGR